MPLSPDTQSLVNQALIQLTQLNFSTALPLLCRDGIVQAFWQEVEEEPAQVSQVGGCCWASWSPKGIVAWFSLWGSRAVWLVQFIQNTVFTCSQSAVGRQYSSAGCELPPSQTVPRGIRGVSCFCPQPPLLSYRAGHRLAIIKTSANLSLKWEVESCRLWNPHFSSLWKCIPMPGYPIVYSLFWHGRAGGWMPITKQSARGRQTQ